MTRKLITSLFAAITVLSFAFVPAASAATNPWSWSDISGQLSYTNNRPVWAMAYASPYWFYTDGLDLWNGGQVYRYDGSTQVNITTDVRNAGLSRVDDIVSDGQSVLFLKGVVARNNQFEAVRYQSGSYTNVTTSLRSNLYSDEGISSIAGRYATWYVVTTKGRLFRWDGTNSLTQVSLPTYVQQNFNASNFDMTYSPGQVAFTGMKMLPVGSNGWLLMTNPAGQWSTYLYNGSTFTDITTTIFPYSRGTGFLVSNGTSVLYFNPSFRSQSSQLAWYDGSTMKGLQYPMTTIEGIPYPTNVGGIQTAAWDGTSWLLTTNTKGLLRVNPTSWTNSSSFDDLGKTRDYFVTSASNGAGTILVGGAVSTDALSGPSYPMIAKLVKVTQGSTTNDNTIVTNAAVKAFGISAWQWIDPNQSTVRQGEIVTYTVGAQHANGLRRVEIWVNGSVRKTCDLTTTSANQTCSFAINGSEYPLNTQIAFNAKVVGRDGEYQAVWTPLVYLTVTDNSNNNSNYNSSNNYGISAWQALDPNVSTIGRTQTVSYTVTAQHPNGLNRAEIYVNGILRRTCSLSITSANQSCTYAIYGGDYTAGTQVSVNAKVVGVSGEYQAVWTSNTYLTVTDTSNNNSSNNYGISAWQWLDPNMTTISRGQSVTYNVGAQHTNGLNRIEIWVNGSLRRTCSLSTTSANQTCSFTVYGNDYPAGTSVAMNAKIVGRDGEYQAVWTPLTYVSIASDATNNNQTSNFGISAWQWFSPGVSTIRRDQTVTYNVGAQHANGLNRAEIWVNGSVRQTCPLYQTGSNQTCSFTLNGSDYAAGTQIAVNAKVVGRDGEYQQIWTPLMTLTVTDASGSVTPPAQNTTFPTTWIWTIPPDTNIVSSRAWYNVGAWDGADGIRRIEIWVNGTVRRVCTYPDVKTNVECGWDVFASDYPNGSEVYMNAKVMDAAGNVTWAQSKSWRVQSNGFVNVGYVPTVPAVPADHQGWVSAVTDHDAGFSNGQLITFTATGGDADGVNRIELYVEGNLVKVCAGATSCVWTGGPYDGTTFLHYGARLYDVNGYSVWTGYKTIVKK